MLNVKDMNDVIRSWVREYCPRHHVYSIEHQITPDGNSLEVVIADEYLDETKIVWGSEDYMKRMSKSVEELIDGLDDMFCQFKEE